MPTTATAKARRAGARLALAYAAVAVLWIALSDWVEEALRLPGGVSGVINTGKGVAFVFVTATLLYVLVTRYLTNLYAAEESYRAAQESLRDKERSIRQAYVDIIDAVTGGKLVLMTQEDLQAALAERQLLAPTKLEDAASLSSARDLVCGAIAGVAGCGDEQMLAVGEALANALKHGIEAEFEVRATGRLAQVVVSDRGPGIDFRTIPKATLMRGYSTKPSLGMGFTLMLAATDRLLLATEPGLTRLVLEFAGGAPESRRD